MFKQEDYFEDLGGQEFETFINFLPLVPVWSLEILNEQLTPQTHPSYQWISHGGAGVVVA